MAEPIRMSIPECQPTKPLDSAALTSKLWTVPGADSRLSQKTFECTRGVQTILHPPIALKPVIMPPSNRFRQEILRRYPHLVNKDSLYDKKQEKLRDPEDPMISTYERDYGCSVQRFELYRSGHHTQPAQEETVRVPGRAYKPGLWCPISVEMRNFYALPGGGWALQAAYRPAEPAPLKPIARAAIKVKWESEYQANINGIAKYMKKIGALTRKHAIVRRMPTLPDD